MQIRSHPEGEGSFLRKRIDDYLSILDRHLQRSVFVVGNDPTVADISLMPTCTIPAKKQVYL